LQSLADSLRAAAIQVAQVAAGRSLSGLLERNADEGGGSPARAALIDLCFGTLRRYGRVQATVRMLSQRSAPDPRVEALLWCALYALESGRYAEYTVVDQAVHACSALGRTRATGYVNALLRSRLRLRKRVETQLAADPVAHYQHPSWWIARVRAAYPRQCDRVLAAGNDHPPMCLRVNVRRSSAQTYLERLAASGIAARRVGEAALLLGRPLPVGRLPGFADGDVSVQDAGAQHAARALDLRHGQRVLDACAAPGGKSAHILELADVALTALDLDASRCVVLKENLQRLGLAAEVRAADCCELGSWWDGVAYDRILADVPCTASGVARRHPDIKWLRREADIAACAARQARILDALWRLLTPGGKLLYATCSVFPEENDAVVEAFLERAPTARRLALPGLAGAQLLPDAEQDGFYFALLEKNT
jgi:16S rRNA (cytosine967-C5)-methyltransferase